MSLKETCFVIKKEMYFVTKGGHKKGRYLSPADSSRARLRCFPVPASEFGVWCLGLGVLNFGFVRDSGLGYTSKADVPRRISVLEV